MSNPVEKAIWYVESHFADDLSLDRIAVATGISKYHLTRAFGYATGSSLMQYVRGRRLSEAAKVLADGADDILTVALDHGYGSHEAFTRAFKDQFGIVPEKARNQSTLMSIELQEAIKMSEDLLDTLEPPRIETGPVLLIAGLSARFDGETSASIPSLWQKFAPHIGNVPNQVGFVTYGVCCNPDGKGGFDYISGVEVSDFNELPADFSRIRLAERRYAVFTHQGHISAIRRTVKTIWTKWLPDSDLHIDDAPDFERYSEDFDPVKGLGGLEIWVPISN